MAPRIEHRGIYFIRAYQASDNMNGRLYVNLIRIFCTIDIGPLQTKAPFAVHAGSSGT
jgi:hypothetical protein